MTNYEINDIIAKYMGESICPQTKMLRNGRVGTSFDPSAYYLTEPYTECLNVLRSVVEKLNKELPWFDNLDCQLEGYAVSWIMNPVNVASICAREIEELKND